MMAVRSGWPNLAPMPYGTPGPMVARVPDSERNGYFYNYETHDN